MVTFLIISESVKKKTTEVRICDGAKTYTKHVPTNNLDSFIKFIQSRNGK